MCLRQDQNAQRSAAGHVEKRNVKSFESAVTQMVRDKVNGGDLTCRFVLSPGHQLFQHTPAAALTDRQSRCDWSRDRAYRRSLLATMLHVFATLDTLLVVSACVSHCPGAVIPSTMSQGSRMSVFIVCNDIVCFCDT